MGGKLFALLPELQCYRVLVGSNGGAAGARDTAFKPMALVASPGDLGKALDRQ